jgi:quercetin dioxygenase-like cupin family protein
MKKLHIDDMESGWFVGNFEPTMFKTKECEVCFKRHPKGEKWPEHYHAVSTEINYLIRGKMTIQGCELVAGDLFSLEPYEIADPVFLEDCELIVVKVPSAPGDKYEDF